MLNGVTVKKVDKFEIFIADSKELLDDAELNLIALEKKTAPYGKDHGEILDTVFRLFHSLKGSASLLDLATVVRLTHEAETMLDAFRKNKAVINGEHLDILIRATDFVRSILDRAEQQLGDEGFEVSSAILIDQIQKAASHICGDKSHT